MEVLFFIVASVLLIAIIYLGVELNKSKKKGKVIEEELAESKAIRQQYEKTKDILKPGEIITHKDTLDEVRKRKFEEEHRRVIENRNAEYERSRMLAELWRSKPNNENKGYDRWYNSKNTCPPKSGSCPLSHCVIPAGTSIHCSGCNRDIQSNEPMYSPKSDSGVTSTSTTTGFIIDSSNFDYQTTTDSTSIIDSSDYRTDSGNDISFGGGDFGGSGAGSSYDDSSSSSDYSSDSGSDYSSDSSSND